MKSLKSYSSKSSSAAAAVSSMKRTTTNIENDDNNNNNNNNDDNNNDQTISDHYTKDTSIMAAVTSTTATTTKTKKKSVSLPSSHQASAKLYNGFIMIIILFGVMTFLISIWTDVHNNNNINNNQHVILEPEHAQKEQILRDFLKKQTKPQQQPQQQPKKNSIGGGEKTSAGKGSNNNNKNKNNKKNNNDNNNNDDNLQLQLPPYHIVFSTSCNDQQHWESYVFFYHAMKVQQRGTVTRIVSGCKHAQQEWLQTFHDKYIATMNSNFFVHFTPDFSQLTKYQGLGDKMNYKYMNKPYGLRHWLETTFGLGNQQNQQHGTTIGYNKNKNSGNTTKVYSPDMEDGIVFLMDPDNILLRPIVHDFTNEDVIFVQGGDTTTTQPDWKIVQHGRPMAQQDGYLDNHWMQLNISYVTNGRGNITNVKPKDGPTHYNTGPPYLATVRDMYNIAVLWTEYAPRVYHIHPKLFAEMYGYIIATTQLQLPHTLIKSIVVSTTGTLEREGWKYIDAIPDDEICTVLSSTSSSTSTATTRNDNNDNNNLQQQQQQRPHPLPIALHYCKRYLLEKWFFSKYRLKKKYISCETPLLAMPPTDLVLRNYTYSLQPPPHGHKGGEATWKDPPREEMTPKRAKREAFMICSLISLINEAAIYFKNTACPNGTANMVNNYTFFTDPNH